MSTDEKSWYYQSDTPVPETPLPGTQPAPWKETRVIGKSIPRVDAYERVSGRAIYPSDLSLPRMLYGAILRSPYPHARVKKMDTTAAEKMEGVRAVLSAASGEAGVYWPYTREKKVKLFDPECLYEGETIAAVAAETPYQAWDAVRAIKVDYEILPFVVDERKSLDSKSPPVHPAGNRVKPLGIYQRGDTDQGFAQADLVLEQTYRTECEIHTPMELHGCLARWERDHLTIWESTQGVYPVQARVAEVLGLPLSRVRVIGHYMGGGFGSKLQADKYTIIAAILAKKTGRPVKLFLTREETYLAVGNRPPANMKLKAGVKKDGTLTALHFNCIGTGGAFPVGGTGLTDWLVKDLYLCPNVRTELSDVYVNAGPSRPFRAPGHPQGAWALEQMMDALAEGIGMDPVELRLKNIPTFSQARNGNPPYTTTGFKECLEEGARAFGWEKARKEISQIPKKARVRRGVGMAGSLWVAGGGNPPSTVILRLFSDGSVNLNMGASDIGTGTKTVMALVVAEELGIKPEVIQIEQADTGTTQYATASGGSKTVPTESPAVRAAAIDVKQQILKLAAEELKTDPSALTIRQGMVVQAKDPSKKIKITDIPGLKSQGVLVGIGRRGPNPRNKIVNPFCAQFCEVECNMKTGEVRIIRFLSVNDSGRVMDRLTYDNQVVGGITMGVGLALTEMRVLDEQTGKMLNKNWHDYKLPTALDAPGLVFSIPLDRPDNEANLTGSKGLGEPVTIPTAAAIANAVYQATGRRMTISPINPVTLCAELAKGRQEE
ncbi:MAG: xanthine dehydrogenase family protein molybdopterin-binding subunit [Deltaproteobacteria bacterium]|nr:xanthine dehydrogenase family protein molybdopterin-binding subunit [Deltaproteobacteria bacterium]